MASEASLNRVVKGAPPASLSPPPLPAPLPLTAAHATPSNATTTDPVLSTLPSSPPQIYLNLLILESSLRAQYLHLLSRRRLNTFFLLLLFLWNVVSNYLLYIRPREDGKGRGGSVYWVIETIERIAWLGGISAFIYFFGTGQWKKGISWPRRWLGTTNRGLRGFNLRVVIVRGSWWRETGGHLAFLLPFALWREEGGSDWHIIETESTGRVVEEDLAPGGDRIKLLLLPRSFSPEFRESWDEYRVEYWERENERRAKLRVKVQQHRRLRAKEAGGWQWWTGSWRLGPMTTKKTHDLEKHPHGHHHTHPQRPAQLSEKDALAKAARRRSLLRSDSSQSHHSSRSSTPALADFDGVSEKPMSERIRRGSSSASARKKARERREGTASARNSTLLSPLTSVEVPPDEPEPEHEGAQAAVKKQRPKNRSRPSTPGEVGSDSSSTLGRNSPAALV